MIRQRIIIVRTERPKQELNEELMWFGQSLGLFGSRDKDKSAFRMFIELLKAARQERTLSSDELSEKLMITRATVVYHLNELMERGLVVQRRKRYLLRDAELQQLTDDLHRDVEETLKKMKSIAREIDALL